MNSLDPDQMQRGRIVFNSVFYIKWGQMLCKGPFYMFGSPCVILIRFKMTQYMFSFYSLKIIIAELQRTLTISNLSYACSTTF